MTEENTSISNEENTSITNEDNISNTFGNIISNLSTFKIQITTLQNQIRNLEKYVKKEFKTLNKETEKNKLKGNRKPSGFAKPSQVSTELCSFMKKKSGTEIARTEVTQYIIQYIKENHLQNPDNKKIIKPNIELKNLLGVNDEDELTFFTLQKHMNKHFNINNENKKLTKETNETNNIKEI